MNKTLVALCCAATLLAGCEEAPPPPRIPMQQHMIWGLSYESLYPFVEEKVGPIEGEDEISQAMRAMKVATSRLRREQSQAFLAVYRGRHWNTTTLEDLCEHMTERAAEHYGGNVGMRRSKSVQVSGHPALRCSWEIASPWGMVVGESLGIKEQAKETAWWMDFHIRKQPGNPIEDVSDSKTEAIQILDSVRLAPAQP